MQQEKTVKKFSEYAAAQFLRTAVFIDDRIYNQKTKAVEPEKLKKTSRKLSSRNANTENKEKILSSPEDADEYKDFPSQQLVNSFAKKQIVCSLYQPGKGESFSNDSDVYELSLASDIVIVDWDLGGTPGEKALELIYSLVHQSIETKPEQLRLILVYTGERELEAIASEVFDKLTTASKENIEPQKEDEGLSMHSSNSRVVILGKPECHRIEKYKSHEVHQNDLAQRSIEEFARLASGLLQGAVLLGLAKIRENNRKILRQFDESIDTAFLLHRAISLPDEEAFEHIHPLLVGEIQAILEDCLPDQIISDDLVSDWALNKWKFDSPNQSPLPNNINPNEFAKNFLIYGPNIGEHVDRIPFKLARKKDEKWEWSVDSINLGQMSGFLFNSHDRESNHKLAILMSQRTSYDSKPKNLTLGTLIKSKEENDEHYLLCILPVCDTVRLDKVRRFIFCTLGIKNPEAGVKKANIIVEEGEKVIELFFSSKSFDCTTIEFTPDLAERKVTSKDNEFVSSENSKRYKWIAQLKPEHAQRAAEQFASNLSRVGLTESEWLRLMSK